MPVELNTQAQFAAFADEVARGLGTHCRTAPDYDHMLSRLIIDDEGRGLSLRQYDGAQPTRLKVSAAVQDGSRVRIGVTAISARHVAQEITRRLYPLHAQAARRAAELTGRDDAEAHDRRTVAEAVAAALPGAHVEENYRVTKVTWQRPHPSDGHGQVQCDTVCVGIGPGGEGVEVELSGCPSRIVAMLAAFAKQ
ncbi:hypothetical protein AB0454_36490 [Streptomyces sp. NPDC093509]|uniref:hypothetical protein n=1 Tax=Streptomyces sp. NPDC093509 TaxID=3154982 RepID=UPI00344CE742